jgi:hypothetical protein
MKKMMVFFILSIITIASLAVFARTPKRDISAQKKDPKSPLKLLILGFIS